MVIEMSTDLFRVRGLQPRLGAVLAVGLGSLLFVAAASAHAEISPEVSLSGKLQLYSLAVPTEKSGLTTIKIVMTVPNGFGIDSFVPPPPAGLRRFSSRARATTQ
jgi:uncharacterized protein YcnI